MKRFFLYSTLALSVGCSQDVTNMTASKNANAEAVHGQALSPIQSINGRPLTKPAPDVIYDIYRKSATPALGQLPSVNPPNFQWQRDGDFKARYQVELSQDPSFTSGVIKSDKIKWCFFNPNKKLEKGTWYWRYNTDIEGKQTLSDTFSFEISDQVSVYEYPPVEDLIANVPKQHPYMLTYAKPLSEVIDNAKRLPAMRQDVIATADKVLNDKIINFNTVDESKYAKREFFRLPNVERAKFYNLVRAYLITGQDKYRDVAIKRLELMMEQKVKGEMALSHIMRAIAKGYDSLYAGLSADFKQRILAKIKPYLETRYNKWSGKTENRQIENHFWQMEMSALFDVALATIHELPENKKYLDYTYGVFMARSPVVGGNDGGWANGHGYLRVNGTTLVNMAYTLQKIGGVDIFSKPWYQGMPDYFLYTAPAGGAIDGFGDMHDRVNNKGQGGALSFYIGIEKDHPTALYQAARVMKSNGVQHSWARLVNGVDFDPNKIAEPKNLPQSKVFKEVGLAAMHTNVTNPEQDLALYFRSSPYGANGHMHANQNSFNISYKGKRVFYSTGYYTLFADPHSITSNRHTRASNSILVNGKGQSFGHEGYGWIKRYLHGEQISYVAGDASMSYRPMINEQWTHATNQHLTQPGKLPSDNFPSDKLKLTKFDRHVTFLRPDVFVIYDDLEAENSNDWELLLHTIQPSFKAGDNKLVFEQPDMYAEALMYSSQPAHMSVTDQFYEKPVDYKKKYKAMPNQYHMSYSSTQKSKKMRFLTFIQVKDSKTQVLPIEQVSIGEFKVGDWTINAQLDTSKAAALSAANGSAQLNINDIPNSVLNQNVQPTNGAATLLAEKINGRVYQAISSDQAPASN